MDIQPIQSKIYEIRGRRVMLDFDLATIYEVETSALKRAVRRNMERFPNDFMFELTQEEYKFLKMRIRCQSGTLEIEDGRGKYPKYAPFAFTQEGIAMLSGVLRSPVAIQANIIIMRAFVTVREYLLSHAATTVELTQLKERVLMLEQSTEQLSRSTDENIEAINDLSEDIGKELVTIYDAIAALSIKPQLPPKPRRPIGFKP
jgi:hypothetical protein